MVTNQRPPDKPRRRWRRGLFWLFLLFLLAPIELYLARVPLAEWAIMRFLSPELSKALDLPVHIATVHVRERSHAPYLELELKGVQLGKAGTRLEAKIPRLVLRIESWDALYDTGVEAFSDVLLEDAEVRIATNPQPAPKRIGPWRLDLPDLWLPQTLPRLPCAIRAVRARVKAGEMSLAGTVRASTNSLELSVLDEGHSLPFKTFEMQAERLPDGRLFASGRTGPVTWSSDLTPPPAIISPAPAPTWSVNLRAEVAGGGALELSAIVPAEHDQTLSYKAEIAIDDKQVLLQALGISSPVDLPWREARASFAGTVVRDHLTANGALGIQGETIRADVAINGDRVMASISCSKLEIERLLEGVPVEFEPQGVVTAALLVDGPLAHPKLHGEVALVDGVFLLGDALLPIERASLQIDCDDPALGAIRASGMAISQGSTIDADGSFDWHEPGAPVISLEADIDSVEIPLLVDWFPEIGAAQGRLHANLSLSGALSNPAFCLSADLEDGSYPLARWERLRELRGHIELSPGFLELAGVDGRIGGGTVLLEGSMQFGGENGAGSGSFLSDFDLAAHLKHVRVYRAADIRVRASGDLTLTGTPQTPLLAGLVTIDRGIYDRNFYPSVSGGGGGSTEFSLFTIEDPVASRLRFDVRVRPQGRFLVRNNRLDVSPFGELNLRGTGAQPLLIGNVVATTGKVFLPQFTLEIQRAEVTFSEFSPFHPTIKFVGGGLLRGYDIEVEASGELLSPAVSLRCTPSLPEEDLLLLVATGQKRAQLEQQGLELVAATELVKFYGPEIWERMFGRSRGESWFDRVDVVVEPADQDKLERYAMEIRLFKWMSLEAERDERGDANIDINLYRTFP